MITALRRLRQKDHKFEASMRYIMSSREREMCVSGLASIQTHPI
jgi:hypothetical protein